MVPVTGRTTPGCGAGMGDSLVRDSTRNPLQGPG